MSILEKYDVDHGAEQKKVKRLLLLITRRARSNPSSLPTVSDKKAPKMIVVERKTAIDAIICESL